MTWLQDIGAIDIRDQLPRRPWIIGMREGTSSITWHYNGPPVAAERQAGAGLLQQLRADAEWQMRAGWGGTKDGAPHLMYHLVVAADGQIYQTAADWEILWHCAHQSGNAHGLAFHLPLGGDQEPTPAQLASLTRATDAARKAYGISIARVLGHLEWRHMTACPGPRVMAHLQAYRAHQAPMVYPTLLWGLKRFQIRPELGAPARVRQAPATRWPDGTEVPIAGRLKPGTIVYVDVTKQGEAVGANRTWVHMARVEHEQADLGFISETLGRWL